MLRRTKISHKTTRGTGLFTLSSSSCEKNHRTPSIQSSSKWLQHSYGHVQQNSKLTQRSHRNIHSNENSSIDELEKETQSDEDVIIDEDENTFNSEELVIDQVLSHDGEIPIDHSLEAKDHKVIVVINNKSELNQRLINFLVKQNP